MFAQKLIGIFESPKICKYFDEVFFCFCGQRAVKLQNIFFDCFFRGLVYFNLFMIFFLIKLKNRFYIVWNTPVHHSKSCGAIALLLPVKMIDERLSPPGIIYPSGPIFTIIKVSPKVSCMLCSTHDAYMRTIASLGLPFPWKIFNSF